MKNIRAIIFYVLSITIMTSCDREYGIPEESDTSGTKTEKSYLKVLSENSHQLNYDGGNINIWIESNTEWTCAISGSSELGLQVDKTKSYGDDVIIVTYANTRNKTYYSLLNGHLTVRWKDSYGKTHTENVTFYRRQNPIW